MKTFILNSIVIVSLALSASAAAGPHDNKIRNLLKTRISAWLHAPVVIDAIKKQNVRNAKLTQDEIDKLDKRWRSERKSDHRPMIDEVLSNELSKYLRGIAEQSDGLYAEIFVMDNKGLNVGQNKMTSDYWQGDEAKWQKTFKQGPDSLFIDDIEYDDSTRRFQIQVSAPVVDPANKANIGAVTIGLTMKQLALLKDE